MGQALQAALDGGRVSQAELARRAGLSNKHVNQLVQDKASLSVDVAVRIEAAFPAIHAKGLLLAQLRTDLAAARARLFENGLDKVEHAGQGEGGGVVEAG